MLRWHSWGGKGARQAVFVASRGLRRAIKAPAQMSPEGEQGKRCVQLLDPHLSPEAPTRLVLKWCREKAVGGATCLA